MRIAVDARLALAWATGSATLQSDGAGPSPLARMGAFPVHVLKLDRRFVGRMDTEPQARRIVNAVLGLARSIGVEAVAEGIEDPAVARALAELGCPLGQGHAFAAAAPALAIEPLLARATAAAGGADPGLPVRRRARAAPPAALVPGVGRRRRDRRRGGRRRGPHRGASATPAPTSCCSTSRCRASTAWRRWPTCAPPCPTLGIVVLSGFEERRMAAKALALGADRYLEKAAGMEDVRTAVRAVHAARRGPAIAGGRAVKLRRSPDRDRAERERHALEIHDNLVQGLTAIHWALEAGAVEQARELTAATLAQAQAHDRRPARGPPGRARVRPGRAAPGAGRYRP